MASFCSLHGAWCGDPGARSGQPSFRCFLAIGSLKHREQRIVITRDRSGGRTGAQREVFCFPPPASRLTSRKHLAILRSLALRPGSIPTVATERVLGAGAGSSGASSELSGGGAQGSLALRELGLVRPPSSESGIPRSLSQGLDLASAAPAVAPHYSS